MKRKEKEAWMLGYQEGYSTGYDDAYSKGYEEGFRGGCAEGQRKGHGRVDFLEIKCKCGSIIPHPIFRTGFSTEFHIPADKDRRCPHCHDLIPEVSFIQAYSEHPHTY